jgi:hypothetical protein
MPFAKYPVNTIVRLRWTGEFARIVSLGLIMNRPESFLNYYVEIEGRQPDSLWAMYEGDFELECLPLELELPKENG